MAWPTTAFVPAQIVFKDKMATTITTTTGTAVVPTTGQLWPRRG